MNRRVPRVLATLLLAAAAVSSAATAQTGKRKACAGCPAAEEVGKLLRERYQAQFTEGWMKEGDLRIEISEIKVLPAIKRKMTTGPHDVPITVYPVETTVRVFVTRGSRGEKMEYMVGAESTEPLVRMFYFYKDSTGKAWTFRTGSK